MVSDPDPDTQGTTGKFQKRDSKGVCHETMPIECFFNLAVDHGGSCCHSRFHEYDPVQLSDKSGEREPGYPQSREKIDESKMKIIQNGAAISSCGQYQRLPDKFGRSSAFHKFQIHPAGGPAPDIAGNPSSSTHSRIIFQEHSGHPCPFLREEGISRFSGLPSMNWG